MTSATAFAPHLAPVHDDSMEVSSSPAGNQYDDEVLIDYDDYGAATFTEDDRMLEDGEPIRPGTATDDMMEDAEPSAPVNEEIMHDDPVDVAPDSYIEDEELIDYSEEDYQDDTQITLEDSADHPVEVAENSDFIPQNVNEPENVDEEIVQQPEEPAAAEESTAHFLSVVEENSASGTNADDEAAAAVTAAASVEGDQTELVEQDDAADELSRQVDAEEAEEAAAQELGVQAFEADEPEVNPADISEGQQVTDETEPLKKPPKYPTELDTTAFFASDGPQTPSDTGIHPITVRYGDVVMPLFKSRVQPDGLLKDDNLASVSLSDLLDNCRHRLAVKIGESVSVDQEFVLSFENMGLQVIEHSPHAFGTSLDDVLEVYLSLHRNDSTQTIPPLALSLSLQLKFTSSFNILKAAAQQGEGMSKFAYLRSTPDELDEYEEEGEEEPAAEQEKFKDEDVGQHYEGEDMAAEDPADGEPSQLEGQEYEEDQHPEHQEAEQEAEQEDDAGQSYDGHQEDPHYEEYDKHHDSDASDEQPHQGNDDESTGERFAAHETHDGLNEDASASEVNELDAETLQELEEPVQPDSAASSTTIRGDVANDTTGEYHNEDFIDFDDDDLTAYGAELRVEDGDDDFSAPAGEYYAEDVASTADDDQKSTTAEVTSDTHALEVNADDNHNDQSSETAEQVAPPEEIHDEVGDDAEQHGQDEDPPADNLGLNEDDLPGEHDEEFDTAFDLLEGHDFEHEADNEDSTKATEGLELDEDDIGFNDDVEEAVPAPNSPLGKRSFDEHVGTDDVAEEQGLKRARS